MTVLTVIALVIGALGAAFGVRCYVELWRWAKQCQSARIAVAYKKRVQLQAPLTEWLMWANQVARDGDGGRVVYRHGGVSVAIMRPLKEQPIRNVFRRLHRRRKGVTTETQQTQRK